MKRTILTAITLMVLGNAMAQQPNFESAMKETLTLFDSAKTAVDLQTVASQFERIATVETTKWEPLYYHAFTYINLSFRENDGDKKDALLDVAQKSIDKALEINGDKSELYAIQGFLYQGRIQVNAMRGMTYSQKATEILEKAVNENPNNPRAQYLLGQNIYYTPRMFGGGSKKALPKFQEAKLLFDKENHANSILPKWGAKSNQRMLETCVKENS
ncbi:MAG: tetratricopeptide repeat protein [Bacteroidales bacterium]